MEANLKKPSRFLYAGFYCISPTAFTHKHLYSSLPRLIVNRHNISGVSRSRIRARCSYIQSERWNLYLYLIISIWQDENR